MMAERFKEVALRRGGQQRRRHALAHDVGDDHVEGLVVILKNRRSRRRPLRRNGERCTSTPGTSVGGCVSSSSAEFEADRRLRSAASRSAVRASTRHSRSVFSTLISSAWRSCSARSRAS